MQIAQQYGLGNAGQGFNDGQNQGGGGQGYQPRQYAPQIPASGGVSLQQAQQMAAGMAGAFNVPAMMSYGMPYISGPTPVKYSGPRPTRKAQMIADGTWTGPKKPKHPKPVF
jgi:hypothetical protein